MTEIFPTIYQLPEVIIEQRVSLGDHIIRHSAGDIAIPADLVCAELNLLFITGNYTGLQLIPTPGYKPDSACVLYEHQGKNYLFTGSTLYNSYGNWQVQLNTPASSRQSMLESLQLLKDIPVDVIITGISINHRKYEEVTSQRWLIILNACIKRLEMGYYQ